MFVPSDMRIRHRNRQEKWPGEIPEAFLKAMLVFAIVSGPCLTLLGLWMFLTSAKGALWVIALGLALLAEGIMSIQTALAQFSFSAQGITVKYPLEKAYQFSWADFQQVCVCYHSRGTEMRRYPIICLVKKGEKKNAFGRWKTLSWLHYRNILCLDYSEELLEAVRQRCPYEVPDLRDQGNYRL